MKWRLTVVEWAVIGLGLALVVAILRPTWERMREMPGRVPCVRNLRLIGQATALYANENGGDLPPTLDTFLTQEIGGEDTLRCEISGARFVYLVAPGMKVSDSMANPNLVVAYEELNSHGGDGVNVLLADGSVLFFSVAELKTVLAATRPVVGEGVTGKVGTATQGSAATRGSSGR